MASCEKVGGDCGNVKIFTILLRFAEKESIKSDRTPFRVQYWNQYWKHWDIQSDSILFYISQILSLIWTIHGSSLAYVIAGKIFKNIRITIAYPNWENPFQYMHRMDLTLIDEQEYIHIREILVNGTTILRSY